MKSKSKYTAEPNAAEPNVEASVSRNGIYRSNFKRPMDFLLSLIGIILLWPILLITCLFVRLNLGSPIIFKQDRPGIDGKMFSMYKFRTMTDEKDKDGLLLPDSGRLTRFGKFLRSTSIDELPQLFNILKGDMSVVGPRPHIIKDVIFMNKRERSRHKVLPGLTGLAQISGRNSIEWHKKLELDLKYIENITFINDWKIILITFVMVIKRKSITSQGMDTGEPLGEYLVRNSTITKEEQEDTINNMEEIIKDYFK